MRSREERTGGESIVRPFGRVNLLIWWSCSRAALLDGLSLMLVISTLPEAFLYVQVLDPSSPGDKGSHGHDGKRRSGR